MRQFVCLMEAPSVCIHQKHWHGFKLKSNKLSAVSDVENRRRRNEGEPNFCINSDFCERLLLQLIIETNLNQTNQKDMQSADGHMYTSMY